MQTRYAVLAVLHVLGQLLIIFSGTYILPIVTSLIYSDGSLPQFAIAAAITLGGGLFLWLLTRGHKRELKSRDGFLLVTLVWVAFSAVATIPLMLVIQNLSFTDAFFETVSGLTTTGSTVLSRLDELPAAVNM